MESLQRAALMGAFHGSRFMLRPVEIISTRLYMNLYLKLLQCCGLTIGGKPRYISTGVKFDDFELITIGDRSVISDRVILLTHDYSMTTALRAAGDDLLSDVAARRPIVIGSNVFVGMGAIILPGTEIGSNSIIGAGAVVRGTVPPDSLALGNPAKVTEPKVSELGRRWRMRLGDPDVSFDRGRR